MPRLRHLADPLRRALAVLCAGLVMALSLVAVSPELHEWLHSAEQEHTCHHHHKQAKPSSEHEHDCAVVLFASGVDLPVAPVALIPPSVVVEGVSPVTEAEFYLVSPRYLRHPERGPPANRLS